MKKLLLTLSILLNACGSGTVTVSPQQDTLRVNIYNMNSFDVAGDSIRVKVDTTCKSYLKLIIIKFK